MENTQETSNQQNVAAEETQSKTTHNEGETEDTATTETKPVEKDESKPENATNEKKEEADLKKEEEVEETRPTIKKIKDDILGKMVRVTMKDGRKYEGQLECIDKELNLFIKGANEIIDKEADYYYPYKIFENRERPENERYHFKYISSVVIPGEHIERVEIDNYLSEIMKQILEKSPDAVTTEVE